MSSPRRLLITSCIRQKPQVLGLFLNGLGRLVIPPGWQADHLIQTNGNTPQAQAMVTEWAVRHGATLWERDNQEPYGRDGIQHGWTISQINRVAAFKDEILDYAVEAGYDAVFLADSDLIMDPRTLLHLSVPGVAIISEIFWTQWTPDSIEMPNVWLQDQYALTMWGKYMDEDSRDEAQIQLLNQLRLPGVYQVGGLGGCTWLARAPLVAGVRFRPILNLSLLGEDRHFCVRADVLGFPLHIDTHVPAFHIYRDTDLPRAQAIVAQWAT